MTSIVRLLEDYETNTRENEVRRERERISVIRTFITILLLCVSACMYMYNAHVACS